MKKKLGRSKRKGGAKGAAACTQNSGDRVLSAMSEAERLSYARAVAGDPRFKILYLIPHLRQDSAVPSRFGFYTEGLHRAAGPLILASTLPADIREPYTSVKVMLGHRLMRDVWPNIIPIELDAVAEACSIFQSPFQVYLTDEVGIAARVDQIVRETKVPILHASSIPSNGRVPLSHLNVASISAYTRKVLDALASESEWVNLVQHGRQIMSLKPQRKPKKHFLAMGHHNVVAPNETALTAFGWRLVNSKRISQPIITRQEGNPQRYVDRICQSADAVLAERERLLTGMPLSIRDYRFVLAVPGMYWGNFENWREIIREARPGHRRQLKQAYVAAIQATTYYDSLDIDGNGSSLHNAAYLILATTRRADMRSFTAGLSALSSATLAPILRLEPKLNQLRGDLKLLAHCVRAEASERSTWKQSRMTRVLGDKMRSLVNPSFLERIDAPEVEGEIEGIKLVGDIPLELLPTKGLPLALRYDVSRLSPIPGNLFLQECLTLPAIVPLSAFSEILIIRSFKSNDPLRGLLETAFKTVNKQNFTSALSSRFVDVQSEDEFVTALNEFEGALMIFDGHGIYDNETGAGNLIIGGSTLDTWALRGKCKMPPIVMFSACDTQPIAGSHSSVATAAFALGAHSVLATMFPISGVRAAIFNGRMLLRLKEFISIAVEVRPLLTWREVVSGMLRMTHASEIVFQLRSRARLQLDDTDAQAVQLAANTAINMREANWYETFLARLSELSGWSLDKLRLEVGRWAGLTDAMKYVQLGNPERIIIVSEPANEILERPERMGDNGR